VHLYSPFFWGGKRASNERAKSSKTQGIEGNIIEDGENSKGQR